MWSPEKGNIRSPAFSGTSKTGATAIFRGSSPGIMRSRRYLRNLNAYPAFSGMKGYVEISRGCPFSCGYCQTPQIFGPLHAAPLHR